MAASVMRAWCEATREADDRQRKKIKSMLLVGAGIRPCAASGLVTDVPIIKGQWITLYDGDFVLRAPGVMPVSKTVGIAGFATVEESLGRGGGCFCRGSTENSNAKITYITLAGLSFPVIVALRRIDEGEEIVLKCD